MTDPVFVDTNVFIYARDAGDPVKQARAAQWLGHLWRQQSGRTSTQVLSEYYVNITRKMRPGLDPAEAWDDVQALLTWRPQAIDHRVLQRGREIETRYRLSWWDSLIVAAAQLQGCVLLLTEDLNDGAVYGGVAVRSPFTLAAEEICSAYEVGLAAAARHRPRGRPRAAARDGY